MVIRRRMVASPRGRVRSFRGNPRTSPSSHSRFPAHQRSFSVFNKFGEITPGRGNTPPGKGPRGRGNTPPGSGGGSKGPPHGRGFGVSPASPEPNPHRLSPKAEASLRRKELIKRRWKRTGVALALASIPLLGWLFFRGHRGNELTPINPSIENTQPGERNGRRKPPIDETEPVDENKGTKPVVKTNEELQREREEARLRRERSNEFRRNYSFKRIYSRDGKSLFLPEKESLEGIDEYLADKNGISLKELGYKLNKPTWTNTGLVEELPEEYNKPGTIVKMAMVDERGVMHHTYLIIGEVDGRPHEFYHYPKGLYGPNRNTGMTGSVIQSMQSANGFLAFIESAYLPDPKKSPWK